VRRKKMEYVGDIINATLTLGGVCGSFYGGYKYGDYMAKEDNGLKLDELTENHNQKIKGLSQKVENINYFKNIARPLLKILSTHEFPKEEALLIYRTLGDDALRKIDEIFPEEWQNLQKLMVHAEKILLNKEK
jgi:nitrogen regulatory protein PII-like uncharacterized protein